MSRTPLLIGAVAVAAALAFAAAIALVDGDDGAPTRASSSAPSTSERAPEAENPDAGELPAAEAAAREFLSGYLRLSYGKPGASIDRLRNASPRLLAALRAEGGHVTPAQSQKTPHIKRVAVIGEGATGALATAQISDAPEVVYPLNLHLRKTSDGWVVNRIGGP